MAMIITFNLEFIIHIHKYINRVHVLLVFQIMVFYCYFKSLLHQTEYKYKKIDRNKKNQK